MPLRRALSDEFLQQLSGNEGLLYDLTERVRSDNTLSLEMRGTYINIYYRGGSLAKICEERDGMVATLDKGYVTATAPGIVTEMNLKTREQVKNWLKRFPILKDCMDRSGKLGMERQIQHWLAHEHNGGKYDYLICDVEFKQPRENTGRFDLIGVHWPATRESRRIASERKLVLMELKYGDGALTGGSGIKGHFNKAMEFLSNPNYVRDLKLEMVKVFNSKLALGLIHGVKPIISFSESPPEYLLLIAEHKPYAKALHREVRDAGQAIVDLQRYAEVKVATKDFLGIGLYAEKMVPIQEFIKTLPERPILGRQLEPQQRPLSS
jgi:hypothetical protein